MGHFGQIFWVEGDNSQQPRWSAKTRDIPVSYGVEILTDDYSVLSKYTHLADGQTELQQQYSVLHYMQSHDKNCKVSV